eukprot:10855354-Prorocentrum_lima.AAC.1
MARPVRVQTNEHWVGEPTTRIPHPFSQEGVDFKKTQLHEAIQLNQRAPVIMRDSGENLIEDIDGE